MAELQGTAQPTVAPSAPVWERSPHMCAVCLMVLFALVRLWIAGSGQLDLAQDEAQYWDWSRRLQLSYYSKGPLIAWIIAVWTQVFGNTELGVRFGAVLGNLAVQAVLYGWLGCMLQRPRLGLITLCLANTTPLFIASGVLMTTDSPLMLAWVVAFACLSALTERPNATWPLWGVGCAVCFGVLAKYMMLAFVPLALVYAVIVARKKMLPRKRVGQLAVALLVGTALGMLPVLIWNIQNEFVSFRHVARLAGVAAAPGEVRSWFSLAYFPEYFASQAGLLLPWWLGIMLWNGWSLLRHARKGVSAPARSAPATVAAKLSAQSGKILQFPQRQDHVWRLHLLLALGFWPLWGFFILWSFHTRIYANWSAMSYVAGIVIAALGVGRLLFGAAAVGLQDFSPAKKGTGEPSLGRRLLPVWAGVSLFFCLVIHGQKLVTDLVPLPAAINPTARLKGWSNLGEKLEALRLSMPNPERVFFFSNAYDVTAALNFYLPGNPVAYCVDFGRRLNQYDLWPDPNGATLLTAGQTPSPKQGWDAIMVTRRPQNKIPAQLQNMFEEWDAPQPFVSTHEGKEGRTFGFLIARRYKGVWPRLSRGTF